MTQTESKPDMKTVRQAAKTGILPERTLRRLIATGKLPVIHSGKTMYLNYSALIEQLNNGSGSLWE